MPTNTPFPGFWDNAKTPYMVELMDSMSPFSPVQIVSVMKGVQLGLTACAENVIAYFMDCVPAEILYVSANEELLEKWATKRLEPLIDSIGMRPKIFAQIENSKSRRTGDKTFSKEYAGGTLNMASSRSASSLRSDSKRVLVLDEVDGAPALLTTGEGNWLDVAHGRTAAWGARKKIMEFSTPTTHEASLIRDRYEMGDRRKFKVPCPCCGVFDHLEFRNLRHEMKGGHLYKVWYECPHCAGQIHNHQKAEMFAAGYWEATATPNNKNHRSYWISSMYSAPGMLSWYELYQKYLDAKDDPAKMRSFTNLYLGMPYKEIGSRPKVEKIIELRGEYREGEVPDGVLFITMGVDVQRGSAGDPLNPPRLEAEILGHGAGFRTWSLGYKVFEGDTGKSAFEGAWEDMHQWALKGGLMLQGRPVSLIFIDSGDGNLVDIVYAFTSRWQNTFPIKGVGALKKRRDETGDEAGPHDFIRYRAVRSNRAGDVTFYDISTHYYKSRTYSNLQIQRRDVEPQRPGFCNFPRDRAEKYFVQLAAEEKRVDGSFHAGGRRNEALDCRVYALCAGDVYLDSKVNAMRMAAKQAGASDIEIQQINHIMVLDMMTKQGAGPR